MTGYEFEKFVEKVQPDLVGSGIKEKYVFQKMGVPFRQMHSWDYSGPYHGYDGFAIFARDMDMAINSPIWKTHQGALEESNEACPARRRISARLTAPSLGRSLDRCPPTRFSRGVIMTQNADNVLDHFELFRGPEYQQMLANKKKMFENPRDPAEVERVREWAKTPEYREKNFAREALTVNPAKACQPLGAVFVAVGFEKTLPFVHGSQGCVAYYRSHLSRHFKEPSSCVSSSMTEDAAVFGGLNNMIDGLANAYSMYKPKMIAVSTTCMAEVIGDDLNAFIKSSKEKGSVPADLDVPFAHTPAFVGSHVTGYDNALKGILEHFWDGKAGTAPKIDRVANEKINFIGGFDGYTVGNMREIKRIFNLMGIEHTILGDNSDVFDTPTDGEFRMYDGGTTLEDAANAVHAKATVSMQHYCTEKTLPFIANHGQEVVSFNHPVGVAATDEFLMALSRLSGKAIPDELANERGRLVDAMADSSAHIHGKKFAIYGDPDLCLGLAALPARTRRRADPCSGDQRQQGLGGEGAGSSSPVRRSARTAMSTRARISGTCARCCSPSRSTS